MKKLKKYGEGMRKTKNEKLKNYVRKKQVLEFVQRLSDSSDSLISSRLDDFFFARSKNEKLFICAEFFFSFIFESLDSRHGFTVNDEHDDDFCTHLDSH